MEVGLEGLPPGGVVGLAGDLDGVATHRLFRAREIGIRRVVGPGLTAGQWRAPRQNPNQQRDRIGVGDRNRAIGDHARAAGRDDAHRPLVAAFALHVDVVTSDPVVGHHRDSRVDERAVELLHRYLERHFSLRAGRGADDGVVGLGDEHPAGKITVRRMPLGPHFARGKVLHPRVI